MLFVLDMQGNIIDYNQQTADLIGLDTYQLPIACNTLIHKDDQHTLAVALSKLQSKNKVYHIRNRLRCLDQRYIWTEWNISKDDEKNVIYVIARDITEATKLHERLIELSELDSLTQLYNRLAFKSHALRELRRAVRFQYSIALLVIDIDGFKQYNDNYGHVQGDECLQQVASTLNHSLSRDSDLLARYGGDEFVVLLIHHDLQQGIKVGNYLRRKVENLNIPHEFRKDDNDIVTLSVGVTAIVPDKHTQLYELVNTADQALYVSKKKQRNHVSGIPYDQ